MHDVQHAFPKTGVSRSKKIILKETTSFFIQVSVSVRQNSEQRNHAESTRSVVAPCTSSCHKQQTAQPISQNTWFPKSSCSDTQKLPNHQYLIVSKNETFFEKISNHKSKTTQLDAARRSRSCFMPSGQKRNWYFAP